MQSLTSTFNQNKFDFNLNQISIHNFSDSKFVEDKTGTIGDKVIIGN